MEISKEELIIKASTTIGSNIGPVYERQNEYEQILKFIKTTTDNSESATLYIRGQPGTGKQQLLII